MSDLYSFMPRCPGNHEHVDPPSQEKDWEFLEDVYITSVQSEVSTSSWLSIPAEISMSSAQRNDLGGSVCSSDDSVSATSQATLKTHVSAAPQITLESSLNHRQGS